MFVWRIVLRIVYFVKAVMYVCSVWKAIQLTAMVNAYPVYLIVENAQDLNKDYAWAVAMVSFWMRKMSVKYVMNFV